MTTTALDLRPPTVDDLPALTAFFGEIQAAYGTGGMSEGELRDWLTSPQLDVPHNFRVARADGRIVGWVDIWDQNRAHERLFLDVRAHPRDRTVYASLLDWGEGRSREIAGERDALLRAGALSDNEPLAAELRDREFRLIRHFFTMEIDLSEEPPPPVWPDGIAVRTFEPDDDRPLYEAADEAFADHWDHVRMSYDDWKHFFLESSDFDPTVWFLAMDGEEIAGFSMCRNERRPDTGHVNILGVRRPWRRRGLARALLLHSFTEFRRRGRARADLGVDAENLTGAVGLYENAGMHVAHRFDSYEKQLP